MRLGIFLVLCILFSKASAQMVRNAKELQNAMAKAKPGDEITMADGIWKDEQLIIKGKGTAEKPIKISAQTAGGVIISGAANLKIGGEYLEISNLHFNNGYSPAGDLIVFKAGTDNLANHCRITGFVIENFSQPDRFANDNWIVLWGKYNRVDHCTIVNKINAGPTLIVELNDEKSQENYHSIDHNYFKGRQRLGSNGGETMRIGVSKYSLTASRTRIKNNYFERCNGEVEIISVKSGENEISGNTFFECEGSLVLRHGSKNVVSANVFLGNNKPFTGGVRVINPGHKVYNNVFKELKGSEFRAALAVMNGVPNSAINRYYQVKDVTIYNNTFMNCDHIDFGTGKDAERTAAPENVAFNKNIIAIDQSSKPIYEDYNRDHGVSFKENSVISFKRIALPIGFTALKTINEKVDGINISRSNGNVGANLSEISIFNNKNTGALWFQETKNATKTTGTTINLKLVDADKINQLLATTNDGDTILFSETGNYKITTEIIIKKNLVFVAAKGLKERPLLTSNAAEAIPALITIANGGSLHVKGLAFSGAFENAAEAKAAIRSTTLPMNKHYNLFVDNCQFYNFNESTFSAIKASKSTFADSLVIKNSLFRTISGTAIDFSAEKEDKGIYNAENTIIENCVFTNILGGALNLYRGGNDESTLGPFLTVNQCTFNEVGNGAKGAVLKLIGVQHAKIMNSIFYKSGQGGSSIKFEEYIADELLVNYCNFYQAGKVSSSYGKTNGKFIYNIAPLFIHASVFNFNLKAGSPLLNQSSKKGKLGASITL